MRVLLLGLTGVEPCFVAWEQWLSGAGATFDAVTCRDLREPLQMIEADGPHAGGARYQGIILADAGLLEIVLDAAERQELEHLERDLGLRRLIAYAFPGPELGLGVTRWSGPLDEIQPRLTAAGHEVFPELGDELLVTAGSWAHLADPVAPARFETLLSGPEGSSLLGVFRHQDGREEMVQTFDANPGHVQGLSLRRGQLAWLTHGVYLGHERHYLPIEVDDVLLANHSWSVDAHRTDRDPAFTVRMTPEDAARAGRWAHRHGLRLDLACNGGGSLDHARRSGAPDRLLEALLAQNGAFGWINHTFRHANISELDQVGIEEEIAGNLSWASEVGVSFEPGTLVTGAHSGLANLAVEPPQPENLSLRPALNAQHIRFVACDASRPYPVSPGSRRTVAPGVPFPVGSAIAVPRHPTSLPHDAVTASQVLDEMRSAAAGTGGPITSFGQVVAAEARRVLATVLANDPRPHYFHQSNMIGSSDDAPGILYTLLDTLLDLYAAHFPGGRLLQPSLAEAGRLLLRLEAWRTVSRLGSIDTWRLSDEIEILNRSSTALEVPITGTTAGEPYGPNRSGWLSIEPGVTRLTVA